MERVMDELEVDADVKKMVVLKTELMERVSKVYGEELRRADVADPNRARFVRDSMSVSVEEALEEKGWRVLETSRSPLSRQREATSVCSFTRATSARKDTDECTTAAESSPSMRARMTELEEEVSVGKAFLRRLLCRVGQLEETLGVFLATRHDASAAGEEVRGHGRVDIRTDTTEGGGGEGRARKEQSVRA